MRLIGWLKLKANCYFQFYCSSLSLFSISQTDVFCIYLPESVFCQMNFFTIYITIILIGLSACTNPFKLREPEEPDQLGTVYYPNTSPEITLQNFIQSTEEKQPTEYIKLFATSSTGRNFLFEPDPYLKNEYIDNWSVTEEEEFFTQLMSSDNKNYPKINLEFTPSQPVFQPIVQGSLQDSVQTDLTYSLKITTISAENIYRGFAKFKLFKNEKNDNNWYIYYWRDIAEENGGELSWSSLKLKYIQ
jgi:hypothetical protein